MADIRIPRLSSTDVVYHADGTREVITEKNKGMTLEAGDILFDANVHTTMIINADGQSAYVIGDRGPGKQTATTEDDFENTVASSRNSFFQRLFGKANHAQELAMIHQANSARSGADADNGILPTTMLTIGGPDGTPPTGGGHCSCGDPDCPGCDEGGSTPPAGSPGGHGGTPPAGSPGGHDGMPPAGPPHGHGGPFNTNEIPALNHGESSGHNGSMYGDLLDRTEQTDIAGKIFGGDGSAFVDKMKAWVENSQFFNNGQTAQEKEAGTYLATNMASKFAVLNPNNFKDEAEASRVYGQAKSLAVAGDAEGLGKLVDQYGDRHGLGNDELVQLFNVNEHEYLHHIGGGSPEGTVGRDLFNSIHAFSLSTNDENSHDGISNIQGGYNDKGQYPQWGWFEASKRIADLISGPPTRGNTPAKHDAAAPPPTVVDHHSTPPGNLDFSNNPEIGQWEKQIMIASSLTGLPPEQIAAQIWAESRGRPETRTQNSDGTTDWGLIQIGQERYLRDVYPKLTQAEKEEIKAKTGKDAQDLDVRQPLDNLIAGAFHIKFMMEAKGGDLRAGLRYYNTGDINGAGSSGYVDNVLQYMAEILANKKLSEDPFNGTNGTGNPGQT